MSLSWRRALSRISGRGNEDTAAAPAHSPEPVGSPHVPEGHLTQRGAEGLQRTPAKESATPRAAAELTLRPGLLAEIQKNRETASRSWSDRPLPFKNAAWDGVAGGIAEYGADLREELIQAYTDIALANNIVWLADDLGRRSDSLDKHYRQLCQSIAGRLERVMELLRSA